MVIIEVRTSESELYFPEDYSLYRTSSLGPVCGEVQRRKKRIGLSSPHKEILSHKESRNFSAALLRDGRDI